MASSFISFYHPSLTQGIINFYFFWIFFISNILILINEFSFYFMTFLPPNLNDDFHTIIFLWFVFHLSWTLDDIVFVFLLL
jgi:hypothetical protein